MGSFQATAYRPYARSAEGVRAARDKTPTFAEAVLFAAINCGQNTSTAGSLLAVHPKDAVLVTVERDRLALLFQWFAVLL